MSSIKTRDIRCSLGKKGFEIDEQRDHIWFNYLTPDGKKTVIRTKISHGKSEVGDSLINSMARQLHLTKADFIKFVSCTLTADEYFKKVKTTL